jgi:hypothetical protein
MHRDYEEKLYAKLEQYEEALKFYADSSNYLRNGTSSMATPILRDEGKRAREALGKLYQPKEKMV